MDVMREQMGSDRTGFTTSSTIDEWLEDVSLVKLIEDAIDSEDESVAVDQTGAASPNRRDTCLQPSSGPLREISFLDVAQSSNLFLHESR